MRLIHFQGSNCFHDCVASIVNHLGINFSEALAGLWSETDFRYDPYREVYLTKRMIASLDTLGARVECFECFSGEDMSKSLTLFQEGDFMIAGMDSFYIPWTQTYKILHGPHYFIAQNVEGDMLPCFDPTYNRDNVEIAFSELEAYTFDICRISRTEAKSIKAEGKDEAAEVLQSFPNMRKTLLSRIYDCTKGEAKPIILLAKYVDAMMCNRYLYQYYIVKNSQIVNEDHLLLKGSHFLNWKAVKNGLYKAAISKERQGIMEDIGARLSLIIDDEIAMAEKIAGNA